jgi:phage tail sheath gpL-like
MLLLALYHAAEGAVAVAAAAAAVLAASCACDPSLYLLHN